METLKKFSSCIPSAAVSTAADSPHPNETHGLRTMQNAIKRLANRGVKGLNGTTRAGKALKAWRQAIYDDLGGQESLSETTLAMIDLACKQKLLLDSIDVWLLSQTERALVNKRAYSLRPILLQRQGIADGLARYLTQIGMKRIPKPLPSALEYAAMLGKDSTP